MRRPRESSRILKGSYMWLMLFSCFFIFFFLPQNVFQHGTVHHFTSILNVFFLCEYRRDQITKRKNHLIVRIRNTINCLC